MALYVIKKCPGCGCTYEHGHDRRGVGIPFRKCADCGALIIDPDENEWQLMSGAKKLSYLFVCVWTALIYGVTIPVAAYFIHKRTSEEVLFILYGCGVLIFSAILLAINSRDIRDSNKRMSDPAYRGQLRDLGLLR